MHHAVKKLSRAEGRRGDGTRKGDFNQQLEGMETKKGNEDN